MRLVAAGATCLSCDYARVVGTVLLCALLTLPLPQHVFADDAAIDYGNDIQPLFDYYCVACHACFDAPCQLDLTHPAGVGRGASKLPVYDGTRLEAAQPTRLFIDARGEQAMARAGLFSRHHGRLARRRTVATRAGTEGRHPLAPISHCPTVSSWASVAPTSARHPKKRRRMMWIRASWHAVCVAGYAGRGGCSGSATGWTRAPGPRLIYRRSARVSEGRLINGRHG